MFKKPNDVKEIKKPKEVKEKVSEFPIEDHIRGSSK